MGKGHSAMDKKGFTRCEFYLEDDIRAVLKKYLVDKDETLKSFTNSAVKEKMQRENII